jgi:hypothetical protein
MLEEKLNMIAQFWKIFKVYLNHAIYQMTLESTCAMSTAIDSQGQQERRKELPGVDAWPWTGTGMGGGDGGMK